MRLTKDINHLFKAEEGIAFPLDRIDKGCAEVDHGGVIFDPMVVIAVGADDILKEPRHVTAGLDVGLAKIPRDLSTDTLGHLIGVLVNQLVLLQLLLLGRDLFGPVSFLNAKQIQPNLLIFETKGNREKKERIEKGHGHVSMDIILRY